MQNPEDRFRNISRRFADHLQHRDNDIRKSLDVEVLTPMRIRYIWGEANRHLSQMGYVDQSTRQTVYFGSSRPRSYPGTGLIRNGLHTKLEQKNPEFVVFASQRVPSTPLEVIGEMVVGPGPIQLVLVAKDTQELRRLEVPRLEVPRNFLVGRPAPTDLVQKLPLIEIVAEVVKCMSPVKDVKELEAIDFSRDETPTFLLPGI